MEEFIKSCSLLFVLLNPFLMSVYLMDLIQILYPKDFSRALAGGAVISSTVFILFAWVGDSIFSTVLQVRFASFLIFGGVVFLMIALKFVFGGVTALRALRGDSKGLAASIAMPTMIGPGTVSASVLVGSRLDPMEATLAILITMSLTVILIVFLKLLHDYVKARNADFVDHYIEIVGRAMALVIGTFAIDMMLQGIEIWLGLSLK